MIPNKPFDAVVAAKKLLREARSGALASLIPPNGDPYCSLVNVATAMDGAPLMLLSKLAIHTRNILADGRVSLMLDERKAGDPLEGARVMLAGQTASDSGRQALQSFLRRQPEAEQYAGFPDFAVYRITIEKAHLVAGFGRIVDITGRDILTDLSDAGALGEAEAEAIAHMNSDHKEALRLYATKLLGVADGDWRCVGLDPEGIELQCGRAALRLAFPRRVTGPGPLRAVLRQLADEARAI